MKHELKQIETNGVGQCRWWCSCKRHGIFVGTITAADTAEDRAKNAHTYHVAIEARNAEGKGYES